MPSTERLHATGAYKEIKGPLGRLSTWEIAERSYHPLDPNQVISSWYSSPHVTGVIFGVQHGVVDIHRYIVNELVPLVNANSVRDIYLEESVTWQQDWEEFRITGKFSSEWKENLDRINRWNGGYEDHRPLYRRLLAYPNFRVTFLDTPENRSTSERLDKRLERDKYMWNVIRNHPPQRKFLVICGAGHAAKVIYPDYNIRKHRDEEKESLAYRISRGLKGQIRTITAVGSSDYHYYPVYRFFEEILPQNSPPVALDIRGEVNIPDSILYQYSYEKRPLESLYDTLVYFPHSRFET